MNDLYLKQVLKEYEQKRQKAQQIADKKKESLYQETLRLQEIENELSQDAIQTAKDILSSKKQDASSLLAKKLKLEKEKLAILKKLGLTSSDLAPQHDCSFCSDTGYVQEGYNTKMCNCIKQRLFDHEYNREAFGNLAQESFATFDINLYNNEVNKEKYGSPISPRENMQNIKKVAEHFIATFENPAEKNLIFMGNSGLGKTFLCNCIANELLKQTKTVLYQTAPVMLDEIIHYRFGKPGANQNILDSLLHVHLLIIDDLGTENMNAMKFAELFNIINTRLLNQNKKTIKTIISTNLSLQQIYQTYDERISSRIIGYYQVCKFFGDDIRFKK